MSGLYRGVSGLALGTGLYRGVPGLWGGASGLIAGGNWSPSNLFTAGVQGFWYDTQDLSTMYQDSAGITPAAVGQPVGLRRDKSGNNNHASQATANSRPILRRAMSGSYYLDYDGVDDFFVSSSIDFTATDAMTVFAAVRKISDASRGILIELSADINANNGAFTIEAPDANAATTYRPRSKGTLIATIGSLSAYAAPISNILTLQGAISTDVLVMRANGTQIGSVATDQGTGNFGNYPLYIGRRGGSSLPFTGHDYGLIGVGKLASAADIASTEAWLAQYINTTAGQVFSLDFTTGVLNPNITFTRASTASYVGSNGLIQYAAVNQPRFGYHPTTLAPLGLLIEEARTNLALWSEDQTNAAWAKTNATIAADAIVAPDGATTADGLIDNATSGAHNAALVITPAAATAYTFSLFIKRGANRYHALSCAGGGIAQNIFVIFDLDSNCAFNVANGSPNAVTAVAYPNGWWRVSFTCTTVSTAALTFYNYACNGNAYGNRLYAGTGVTTVYAWGAEIEAGAFPSSYNPTTSAAVAMSPDVAVMTGSNFSSWFNPLEGTFVAGFTTANISASGGQIIFSPNDGSANNLIESGAATSNNLGVRTGGVSQASITAGTPVANALNKLAIVYKLNDFSASLNGAAVAVDTSGTVPVVNKLSIGANFGVGSVLNGYLASLTYFNIRVADATLQILSGPIVPVFNFDFTTGALDSRVIFTRASTGTFVGANGLIQTAAIDAPRFEYDPITAAPQGLLVEDARTNQSNWSEDFTNVSWGKTGITVTADAVTAPDGATTADAIVEDATTGSHVANKGSTSVAGSVYVFSVWLKRGSRRYAALQLNGAGIAPAVYVSVDFDNNGAMFLGQGTAVSYSAVKYSNGWYRVQLAVTAVDVSGLNESIYSATGPLFADRAYTGTPGAVAYYAWGAQVEIGTYATSYIPTAGGSVTRARDDAKITGLAFSQWYNQNEGTFVVSADGYPGDAVNQPYAFAASDGTGTNRIFVRSATSAALNMAIVSGAGTYSDSIGTISLGVLYKAAVAYKTSDYVSAAGGTVHVSTAFAGVPTNTQLNLGAYFSAGNALNGHLRSLTYYNSRMSNAFLATATGPSLAFLRFDPLFSSANLVYDPEDRTVARILASGGRIGVRGVTPHSTGKQYAELKADGTSLYFVGLVDSLFNPSGTGGVLGENRVGQQMTDLYTAGGVVTAMGGVAGVNQIMRIAYDADAELIWVKRGSGPWNNNALADPVTGVGGLSTAGLTGPAYVGVVLRQQAGAGVVCRVPSDPGYSLPPGFVPWS